MSRLLSIGSLTASLNGSLLWSANGSLLTKVSQAMYSTTTSEAFEKASDVSERTCAKNDLTSLEPLNLSSASFCFTSAGFFRNCLRTISKKFSKTSWSVADKLVNFLSIADESACANALKIMLIFLLTSFIFSLFSCESQPVTTTVLASLLCSISL